VSVLLLIAAEFFSISIREFLHHLSELFEGDLAVSIRINLFNDVVDSLLTNSLSEAQNFFNLLRLNVTGAILQKIISLSGELFYFSGM
jgi:hypothetical protein